MAAHRPHLRELSLRKQPRQAEASAKESIHLRLWSLVQKWVSGKQKIICGMQRFSYAVPSVESTTFP